MSDTRDSSPPGPLFWLLPALSMSIGWGIRGNFGHEAGAMIAGVLGALAVVIVSGREDWLKRSPWFAAFGALGWSFGGSMSYGQVIGYTHSGDSASVLYGFASLFVIGFLWGALGGAGAAFPAYITRKQLFEFVPPLLFIFSLWYLRDQYEIRVIAVDPAYRHEDPLYWFDTDWTAALLSLLGVLIYAGARRRWDKACSVIAHVTIGWWAAFLILVVLLGIRMTPPRGDSWAGCLGMVAGLWIFLARNGLHGITLVSVTAGIIGGLGFSGGILIKLVAMTSGLETNWHSVMEQTYGFINGVGMAAAIRLILNRAPRLEEESPPSSIPALVFSFLGVGYLNIQKNPEAWVEKKAIPEFMYGIHAANWMDLAFALFSLAVVFILLRHRRQPLPFIPPSPIGKTQLLYLAFMWMMNAANFERALPGFTPQRLITEGVITMNVILCTFLAVTHFPVRRSAESAAESYRSALKRTAAVGVVVSALAIIAQWGIVRAVYGNETVGSRRQVRFGPDAVEAPKPGVPHP